jgi:hypothetical protein
MQNPPDYIVMEKGLKPLLDGTKRPHLLVARFNEYLGKWFLSTNMFL